MSPDTGDFTVGGWLVRPLLGQVSRDAEVVRLEPKVMDVLVCLARHAGEVVSRQALIDAVWPGTYVEDQAVTRAVWHLRQALGWHKDGFLETIPKRGYRLTAPVTRSADHATAASPPPPPPRRARQLTLAAAAVALLVLVAAVLFWPALSRAFGPRERVMLAVLPFENLTGVADQDFVGDGLTEELITRLGALKPERLGVIARTSSFTYKGTRKRGDQIGRELGVDYFLEGSIRQEGDRLRIVAQLITTKDQTHVWAQGYDDDRTQLLRLYDRVAEAVTEQVRARIAPDAAVPAAGRTVNPDANEAYLKGRYALTRGTGPSMVSARDFFRQAVEGDAGYAQAWAGLATASMMVANYNAEPPAAARQQAKAAAIKALELDRALVEARLALAGLKMEHEWDFTGAELAFRQAVTDSPNSAQAHQWYGALLCALGRFDDAIAEIGRARRLDPASLRLGVDLGRAYYYAHRYDEAAAAYRKVMAVEPKFSSAHTMLGLALLAQGRHADGIAEMEQGAGLLGTRDGYSALLGYAYAVGGRRADAEKILAKQTDKWTRDATGAAAVALTYVGLGDHDQAFAWLDKALDNRDAAVAMIKAYPYWDPLRTSPRYRALLQRLRLPL